MGFRIQDSESGTPVLAQIHAIAFLRTLFIALCGLIFAVESYPLDLHTVVAGLEKRYASAETIAGNFQQTYRAPGIEQIESGTFRMKRPGLMRWEYRQPEEKLFVADGREAFLYVPLDRQVTVQPLSPSDLHGTPLEFLLGRAEIHKLFVVSWETQHKAMLEKTLLIRLTPRRNDTGYEFLVLELDSGSFELRRIVIEEKGGNTSEFLLTNININAKVGNREFQFKPPKGVEVVRFSNEN